jgi:hypothetical protein
VIEDFGIKMNPVQQATETLKMAATLRPDELSAYDYAAQIKQLSDISIVGSAILANIAALSVLIAEHEANTDHILYRAAQEAKESLQRTYATNRSLGTMIQSLLKAQAQ